MQRVSCFMFRLHTNSESRSLVASSFCCFTMSINSFWPSSFYNIASDISPTWDVRAAIPDVFDLFRLTASLSCSCGDRVGGNCISGFRVEGTSLTLPSRSICCANDNEKKNWKLDARHTPRAEFIKLVSSNWFKSIMKSMNWREGEVVWRVPARREQNLTSGSIHTTKRFPQCQNQHWNQNPPSFREISRHGWACVDMLRWCWLSAFIYRAYFSTANRVS